MAVKDQFWSDEDEFLSEQVGEDDEVPLGFEPDDDEFDDDDDDSYQDGDALDNPPY